MIEKGTKTKETQTFALERRADNILPQNCNIFSVSSIFKRNPDKTSDKFIIS